MKESSSKIAFDKLLNMLPMLERTTKNVSLLGGTGGGWPARLAFNPCGIITLMGAEAAPDKLIRFINEHKGKLTVGFISYDFGLHRQGVKSAKSDDLNLPDIYFLAYDNYLEAVGDQIKNVGGPVPLTKKSPKTFDAMLDDNFRATISTDSYNEMFDKIISYIKSGHVYQINLTHRLQGASRQNPRVLFSQMAKKNQASMMGYIEGENFELLSVSPESFLKTDGALITTAPIKGTRARTGFGDTDEKKLLGDFKEQSELSMITDLLRNDLAKVSKTGSVRITKLRTTQKLTSVVHTFSEITATLKNGISPIEALLSMLPGGSVTGCPKKRAMEIIEELEPARRGVYCGSLICIDPDGNLDSNILIRTILKKGQKLVLPIGGGIVFDSNKNNEYQETLDKASSITESLQS
ncbi:anthranilate synthase component I family protein [Candidatus Parcubacteria bacterium]|nr:anthranilate synthase component I family protein [Candidatus Parcubacteria bacterium]